MKKIFFVLAFVFGMMFSSASFAATVNDIDANDSKIVLTEAVSVDNDSTKEVKEVAKADGIIIIIFEDGTVIIIIY